MNKPIIEVRDNANAKTWRIWTPRKVDHIPSPAAFVANCNRFYGYEKYRIREEDQNDTRSNPKKRTARKKV